MDHFWTRLNINSTQIWWIPDTIKEAFGSEQAEDQKEERKRLRLRQRRCAEVEEEEKGFQLWHLLFWIAAISKGENKTINIHAAATWELDEVIHDVRPQNRDLLLTAHILFLSRSLFSRLRRGTGEGRRERLRMENGTIPTAIEVLSLLIDCGHGTVPIFYLFSTNGLKSAITDFFFKVISSFLKLFSSFVMILYYLLLIERFEIRNNGFCQVLSSSPKLFSIL